MYRDPTRDPDQDLPEATDSNPFSPNTTGFANGQTPKSLNPTTTFEDELAGIKAGNEPSEEEKALREQATEQEAKPEDATARFAAQAADIVGGTFDNYAKGMGVSGAGARPFQEGEKALEGQLSLREQLHKNLLDKAAQKKAEREAKTKGLYEKMGAEMKVAGEKRTSTEFDQAQAKTAVGTPEAQQRSEFYKKAFNVDLDPSTLSAADMDKFAPEMRKATPAWAESDKVPGLYYRTINGKLETQQRKVDMTGLLAGKGSALDAAMPTDQLMLLNQERAKRNQAALPEGTTWRAANTQENAGESTRRGGVGIAQSATEEFTPMKLVKGSAGEREYNRLVTETSKVKDKLAANLSEVTQLKDLLDQAMTNPVAANAAQRQVAMMFNKGALSEGDVRAFSGSQNVIDRLQRSFEQNLSSGRPFTAQDVKEFQALLPSLQRGVTESQTRREADIRRRASSVHPGFGDYLFGASPQSATQPSTNTQKSDTMPQQGAPKKRFIVDGQPRELSQEEFKAEKARGAKITR